MGLFAFRNNTMYRKSLYTVLCSGCAGVFLDADHLIAYYFVQVEGGRFLHLPVLILSSIVLCGLVAYLGGLLLENLLKRRNGK